MIQSFQSKELNGFFAEKKRDEKKGLEMIRNERIVLDEMLRLELSRAEDIAYFIKVWMDSVSL